MIYTFDDYTKIPGVTSSQYEVPGITTVIPQTDAAIRALIRMDALPESYVAFFGEMKVMLIRCTGAASQNRVVAIIALFNQPNYVEWHMMERYENQNDEWLPTPANSFGTMEWVDIQNIVLSEFHPAGKTPEYASMMSGILNDNALHACARSNKKAKKASYFNKLPSWLPVLKEADLKAIKAQYELAYDMAMKDLSMDITDEVSEAAITRAVERSLTDTDLLEWHPDDIIQNYSPVLMLIPIEGLDIATFDAVIRHYDTPRPGNTVFGASVAAVGMKNMSPALIHHILASVDDPGIAQEMKYDIAQMIRLAIRAKNQTVMTWLNAQPYQTVLDFLSKLPTLYGCGFSSLIDRALDNPGAFRKWVKDNAPSHYSEQWRACFDQMDTPLMVATFAVTIGWHTARNALSYHPYTNMDILRGAINGENSNVAYLPILMHLLHGNRFSQEEYYTMTPYERALCDYPPSFEELFTLVKKLCDGSV